MSGARLGEQPVVTYALIAVNLAFFVVTALQARAVMTVTQSSLYLQGALLPELASTGEWWRVLTSGFLHVGLWHIAVNMFSLYFLGLPLERILGRVRFGVVYGLSLLGGSAAVMLFSDPLVPTAGASGAIFGLMGALLVTVRRLRYDARQLIAIVVINLIITFQVSNISWQAHLGGLVVGAAIGAVMVYPPREQRKRWQLLGSIGIGVVLIAVMAVRAVSLPHQYCSIEPTPTATYLVRCAT
ncbi:rhomboid family intramembrane serine protease [Nakamurella leprariae]|uniref:Rhomboid family intramembrane serine protease n=1 Tax=Nakamurella leprariae TaxID=2803911 RepID=A0A939BXD8_9ACTN|nr:rhomboid family intramembrane serine protease [Nakamurella leprariae]MBM9468458.1 rhomboid family intramembrane serine protease [Nakamurella leprariae]